MRSSPSSCRAPPNEERSDAFWSRFFSRLRDDSGAKFLAESVGGLIHCYIRAQLRAGAEPKHLEAIRDHWREVVSYHQRALEHAPDERLAELKRVGDWLVGNDRDSSAHLSDRSASRQATRWVPSCT